MSPYEFMYGGQYYPLSQDKSEWRRDLQIMKDSGLNFIRTGEIVNSWEKMEPQPGIYDFNTLLEFFDLCEEIGLKILLGTGTNVPPVWLQEIDPNVNLLNQKKQQYPANSTYGWACYNNPTYRKRAISYLTKLVDVFKDHNALYMYQLNNEIGYPFMPLSKDSGMEVYCYCEHCQTAFREWVKKKYKTLEAVDFVWRWGPTNSPHYKWDQVVPPYTKPSSWSSVTRWLDWRLFHMDQITKEMQFEHDLIKQLDNKRQTITNIFYMKSQDRFGVYNGLDHFKIGAITDKIGYDLYPGSGDKSERFPEYSSMFLDHAKSVARYNNKELWLSETEAGPIGGWIMGPHRNSSPENIFTYVIEALGHNFKSALFMCFREMDFMSLNWGGAVNHDGSPSKRTKSVQKLGEFLSQESDFLINSDCGKGTIALLVSKNNYIIFNGIEQENAYYQELRGTYTYYWEQGYNIDFISPEHVQNGYANDYKVIHAPLLAVIDNPTANALGSYVNQGGILISNARFAHFNQFGWHNYTKPGFDLNEILGVQVEEVWSKQEPEIQYRNQTVMGEWHKELLQISDSVSVVATFEDETPAVTINKHGDGYGIYFATQPGTAHLQSSELYNIVLTDLLNSHNITPYIRTEYSNKQDKEFDVHSLKTDKRELLLVTNYIKRNRLKTFFNENKKEATIIVQRTIRQAINWQTKQSYDVILEEGSTKINVVIEQDKALIIELIG